MQSTRKDEKNVTTGSNSNVTTGDDSDINTSGKNNKDGSNITVGDIILKVNEMTVHLDNDTVSKLLEIIDMLRENQIILMSKIDRIEISILEMKKANE